MKRRFPSLAVIVLIFALVWLLTELGYFNLNVPWLPLILVVVALGWIINRLFF